MLKLEKVLPKPGDLTLEQAAAATGVHRNTVRRWVVAEGLPAYRWGRGGRIMIDPDNLAAFLQEHRRL
jgi:excisionase family DNA binding protein